MGQKAKPFTNRCQRRLVIHVPHPATREVGKSYLINSSDYQIQEKIQFAECPKG